LRAVILFIGLAAIGWLWFRWKVRRAEKKIETDAKVAAAVEVHYQEHNRQRKALREKYDPEHKWPDFSGTIPSYQARTEMKSTI
jgi:hypothetical protein